MQTGILAMTAALTISCSGAAMALQPREVMPEAGGEGQAVSETAPGNASLTRLPQPKACQRRTGSWKASRTETEGLPSGYPQMVSFRRL